MPMPFQRNNTEGQKRKDRSSESEGQRKRSSLESVPSQLAISRRFKALVGANFWFPPTLDGNWIKDHFELPMLHVVMDADLSRFKTIVSERLGQFWACSSGERWRDFCYCLGFSWRADWQSHFVAQGTDSNGDKINFHPNPSSCPLNVLSHVQLLCTV